MCGFDFYILVLQKVHFLSVDYGCPFAHLLSACTCYIFQNFNDKNVAAHLKFEPHMSLSRPRKSLLLRSYDISAQFCAARLSLMTGLLIPNILQIFFEIRPHIFWMSVYAWLCPPFVEILAKMDERHSPASPLHVTIEAQIRYAVRAGTAAQAEYFINVRTTL